MNRKILSLIVIIFILIIGGIFLCINSNFKNFSGHNSENFSIASGVVPHHLVAKEIIENFFQYTASKGAPRNIILLGPDHFNATSILEKSFITVDLGDREFDGLTINNNLLQKLNNNDFAFDGSVVNSDHCVTAITPYIKKYFPESNILPIVISYTTSKEDIERLIEIININSDSQTMVIASVDFSHYLSPKVAAFHDIKSIATLIDFEKNDFKNLEVDSWQSLYGARLFAKLQGKEALNVIGQGNSADFLESDDFMDTEGTTSYFSSVFEKADNQKIIEKGKTILLVGDIMLDRDVESLINKNGVFYPFQKINRFLSGIDIVFGNLEGPIVKEPQDFPFDSLKFNFLSQVVDGLSWANFNLFSLANNHILNGGENGLKETRQFLKEKNIDFVGDLLKCTEEFSFKKDEVIFLSFDKTLPFSCSSKEIVSIVNSVKSSNVNTFLIVSIHWGVEYQEKNSIYQQELAYKIIDAGADTIIGHHPHVVQNIEIYKNKPIFYSLGNFIFDQYFSKNTQEGLAVGIALYDSKVSYNLFPFKIPRSQPSLMTKDDTNEFLNNLASKSSSELFDEIKNGIINIERAR